MNLPAGANAVGCSVGAIDPKGNVAAWNAEHTGVQSPFALKVGDTLIAVKDGSDWTDVRALPYQKIIDLIRSSKGKSVGLRLRRYDDMETRELFGRMVCGRPRPLSRPRCWWSSHKANRVCSRADRMTQLASGF